MTAPTNSTPRLNRFIASFTEPTNTSLMTATPIMLKASKPMAFFMLQMFLESFVVSVVDTALVIGFISLPSIPSSVVVVVVVAVSAEEKCAYGF